MDVTDAKTILRDGVERLTPALADLPHSIRADPELNVEEHHGHQALTGVLEDDGTDVGAGTPGA